MDVGRRVRPRLPVRVGSLRRQRFHVNVAGMASHESYRQNKHEFRRFVEAVAHDTKDPTLSYFLVPAQWDVVAEYVHRSDLAQGQVLITQGAKDRTLYLVESGNLTVHFEDSAGYIRQAIVGAGTAVGEGSFFSHLPRSATVQAATPCRVWSLSPMRFSEMSNRQPGVALALALALGAVVSRRMLDSRKRNAVT